METIFSQMEIPIEVKQGSLLSFTITFKDKNGTVIDLTDYTAKLQVRRSPNSTEDPDIELTNEDGLSMGGEAGTIGVTFAPATTLALSSDYTGTWDLFLIPTEATALCLLGGTFTVIPSTTKV